MRGLIIGGLLLVAVSGLMLSGVFQLGTTPLSPWTALWAALPLATAPLAAAIAYRLYGLLTASYSVDRNGLTLRWGLRLEQLFRELFARRCVDIAQPDICASGGFTGCRHIAALAHAHGVQVNPHVWGSAVGQAASLQLIAAIPTAHHSLFAQQPLLEFDTSSHPFREHLTDAPLRHGDGWVEVPKRPGLGIEVQRAVLKKYSS